ncbi:MAG: 5-formyltetrahydrofolate cyclo-ligase [Eubacteriales bacterium]|nr:5-formyltetrahydrofolate cyclo-ligase [Eubacteriales bacterium]
MWGDKQQLRRRFLAERAAQSAAVREAIGRQIAAQVMQHPLYQRADCVFCYVSVGEEIDTHQLLRDALDAGKTVCVPRCETRGQMSARQIRSLDEVQPIRFGLLEPSADAPEIDPAQIGLVLAPALACDRQGYRLGYGGGYYDRFLSRTPADTIVLCAAARLVERLPRTSSDRRCGFIATEGQVLRTDEER